MKKLSTIITAILMAVIMAAILPVQVFADAKPEYISEIKIGMGKNAAEAKAALKGYKILDADLNQNAGGGWGSKGEKAVYLGYKTTSDKNDAITDLALMNMKGGYSVKDYEALMETQMKTQIIPFVDSFLAAINEYRENYNAKVQRAVYIHDILNKFIDDDTGAGLGDLLLNETKYEMGDDAYNKLSDAEKKKHADIVTILAQSNGQATLMMENLITRAADTNDDTWIDRFAEITYDDLVEATGKMPTDAAKQIARLYDDNANTILDMWDAFQEDLSSYDEAVTSVKNYDESDYTAATDALNSIDENTSEDEAQEIIEEYENQEAKRLKIRNDIQTVGICETLKTYDYNDGTLLDFFLQPREEIEDDITVLYPLVASLTEGQLAGLDFISLKELTAIALTTDEGYSDASLDALKKISIYDGVDRSIYEKGGVALTSDALRADAEAMIAEENSKLGGWSIAMFVITGLAFVAFASCVTAWIANVVKVKNIRSFLDREVIFFREAYSYNWGRGNILNLNPELKAPLREGLANTKLCKYLSIGAGVLMVVLAGVSVYLTYLDMVNYYKVEFTPQPHYIIDEKDLIGYNKKGEKIVLKNQYAYYKIVECNRNKSAEFYNVLGTGNDLNGDVGKQWLTLYVAKNDAEDPIIASSLKAVVGNDNIPTGYETGIHMFGSNSAYNLNNTKFVWNKSAKSVYVYFTRDENANASEASSIFSTGTIALSGGLGLALGAVLGAVAMTAKNKKKENQTLATD